ncbi:MAG: SPOR domain-containing protein, partial [Gammaproteobacteria bacterium]
PQELGGPQFAPLTEAEIKRGARLPPLSIAPTPADPGLPEDRPAKPPAAPTTVPAAAPRAVPPPSAEIRALDPPTALPATGPTDTARPRKDPPAGSSGTTWAIQLGSFTSEANAKKLRHRLQKLGFQPFVERITVKTQSVFRVRVGPERERQKAEALRAKIRKQANLDGILVRYP